MDQFIEKILISELFPSEITIDNFPKFFIDPEEWKHDLGWSEEELIKLIKALIKRNATFSDFENIDEFIEQIPLSELFPSEITIDTIPKGLIDPDEIIQAWGIDEEQFLIFIDLLIQKNATFADFLDEEYIESIISEVMSEESDLLMKKMEETKTRISDKTVEELIKDENFLSQFLRNETNLSFLVGAGISIDAPSLQPAGCKMMNAIIKFFFPESEHAIISELEDLRFETLVELVRDNYDTEFKLIDYYDQCDKPNIQHYF
jgi:hypothetical protein